MPNRAKCRSHSQLKEDYPQTCLPSSVLDELVVYAQMPSCKTVCKTYGYERRRLNKAIQKSSTTSSKKKEEAEAQQREEYLCPMLKGPQFNNDNSAKQNTTILSGDKSWYFYNKPMVSAGKTEFQRIWVAENPEDDRRRRNKSGFSMSDCRAIGKRVKTKIGRQFSP